MDINEAEGKITPANFDEVIISLSSGFPIQEDILCAILYKLEQFYQEYKRHDYSPVSNIVFNSKDESIEIVLHNLDELIRIASGKTSVHLPKFKKLYDHINLCVVQKRYFEDHMVKMNEEVISATQKLNKINSITTKTEKDTKKISDQISSIESKYKKIIVDFVAILGIFSSIIFAAFGGLEILKNILGNIEKVQTGKLLVFGSLTVSAVIMLLFILLNGISKLTSLNLKSCNCKVNEIECTCNFIKKHPSIYIMQASLIFVFFLGITEYLFDFNRAFKDWKSWTFDRVTLLISLLSILYFACIIGAFIHFKNKNTKKASN